MTDYALRRTTMVDTQVRPSDVTKFPVIDAMLNVRREVFVPDAMREAAYLGENIPLGGGRALLAPRSFAKMLDAANIRPDELVLDIGCGLGYSAAVIARMAEAVVAVEEGEMADDAESLLSDEGADNVALLNNPLVDGAPEHGGYDVIMIEGAVERLPESLTDQLKEGGRIVAIFAEGALGIVRVGLRVDGRLIWRDAFHAGAPVLPGFAAEPAFVF